MTAKTVSSLSV